ncbi:hypothetical protein [Lacrimispora aerotolerans]|uniref:hypothetical protein n=1 Tax=Lacrimispora aerotolerans TaxID=36832 RepID=UPI00068C4C38|nr:hypothetical protein [Lacrimispora aerotolerans]
MRKVKLFILTAVMSICMSITALAGQWIQDNNGWRYQVENGKYPVNDWLQDNGKWYHFHGNGYMQTGWLEISSKWY